MSDVAIRVEHLSKSYRIRHQQTAKRYATLREDLMKLPAALMGKLRNQDETFWALDDVSFEIHEGEVVGIIGRNGAGKSTLLKILARITEPTRGRAEIFGRVGSLLEVGTGFHPELTGRENIYLSGAILGMTRAEIRRKFDEIVDFAEVEKFLDTPAKHYSSGMYVRLAFAVAAHLEPEILLVDEVLAVGDAQFQKKCLGKMGEVAQGGRTVLFVSHNMGAVRQLCKSGIVLQNGRLIFSGDSDSAIEQYLGDSACQDSLIIDHVTKRNSSVVIESFLINSQPKDKLTLGPLEKTLTFHIAGTITTSIRMEIEVRIKDIYGNTLALYAPGHLHGGAEKLSPGEFVLDRVLRLPHGMTRGVYSLDIELSDPNHTTWVEIPRGFSFIEEGVVTHTGRTLEYSNGSGWLFLQ